MSKLTRGEFFLNSRPFSESFLVSRKCQLVLAMMFAAVHAADLCWKVWSVRRADCRSGQPRRLRSCIRTMLPASPLASSLQQESCRRGRNQTLCSFFSLSRDTPAYAVNTFRSGLAPSPSRAFLVFESFACLPRAQRWEGGLAPLCRHYSFHRGTLGHAL